MELSQPRNPVPTPWEPRQTPHSSDELTLSGEPTADLVATESELVQRLSKRILQAIADKNLANANEVYSEVHRLGVREAVKAMLTDAENKDFRQLVKLWQQTKTQP